MALAQMFSAPPAAAQSGDASLFGVAVVCHGVVTELPGHPILNLQIHGPVKYASASPTLITLTIPSTGFAASFPAAPLTVVGTKLSSSVAQGRPLATETMSTTATLPSANYSKLDFDLNFAGPNTGTLSFVAQHQTLVRTEGTTNVYGTRTETYKISNLNCWKI